MIYTGEGLISSRPKTLPSYDQKRLLLKLSDLIEEYKDKPKGSFSMEDLTGKIDDMGLNISYNIYRNSVYEKAISFQNSDEVGIAIRYNEMDDKRLAFHRDRTTIHSEASSYFKQLKDIVKESETKSFNEAFNTLEKQKACKDIKFINSSYSIKYNGTRLSATIANQGLRILTISTVAIELLLLDIFINFDLYENLLKQQFLLRAILRNPDHLLANIVGVHNCGMRGLFGVCDPGKSKDDIVKFIIAASKVSLKKHILLNDRKRGLIFRRLIPLSKNKEEMESYGIENITFTEFYKNQNSGAMIGGCVVKLL